MSDADGAADRLGSGAAWEALVAALADARRRVEAAAGDPQLLAEGHRYLLRLVAAGIAVCVEHADPDDPSFTPMIAADRKWGLDIPDGIYLYASVRADGVYRIHGPRGSAHHLDVQVNAGHFADGEVGAWRTVASTSALELGVAPGGHLELHLGGAPRPGAWLPLDPDAEFVLVRQYFGDWSAEAPASLAIERAGQPLPAPLLGADALARRLARLVDWIERGGALWERMARSFLELAPNSLVVHDPGASAEHVGLRGQTYALGNYRCAPGEAVLVELEPPRCHFWSASLASCFFESLDYRTRQGSLNSRQARLDADGRLRLAIAHEDPGVPNWLDAAGHREGILALRFLLAQGAPEPELRALPLSQLRAALPRDTPHVSPAERAEALRRRREGVDRRVRG